MIIIRQMQDRTVMAAPFPQPARDVKPSRPDVAAIRHHPVNPVAIHGGGAMRGLTKNILGDDIMGFSRAAMAAIIPPESVRMRRSAFQLGNISLYVAFAFSFGQTAPAQAAEVRSFVLAPSEGYGVQECLDKADECGLAMADAWCQSQGRGRALSYGPSDALTDAAPGAATKQVQPSAYVITCGD
jgi:hypothetical protein